MDVEAIEQQLRKRLAYPYRGGRSQNNQFDGKTNFIYNTSSFDEALSLAKSRFGNNPDFEKLLDYALNRWFNFWSAIAVEEIFCSLKGVEPARNRKDRLEDFKIHGITFDHKTSVFPKQYPHSLEFSMRNPRDLIKWLYDNQSQENRMHLKNRLFIVLYSNKGEHWKLKADLSWLRTLIEKYVEDFNPRNLQRFSFEPGSITVSDLIWAIR